MKSSDKKSKNVDNVDRIGAERKKVLDATISKIERDFGKGAVMMLGDNIDMNIETISTGSLGLDLAIGVGGLPKGRIVEIYGPESSGKTTVALHAVAEAQKAGGLAMDPVYAKALGVDIDNLIISQPDNGEQALEIAESLVKSGVIDILVIDSVAALVPRSEIEGDMGDSHVGLQARLMSQALRKLTASTNRFKTVIIFINQLREKIGVMFGNPETTTGGRALKFYSTLRLDIRKFDTIKKNDVVVGNRTRVKVVKNKVAPPFRQAEFDIMYGEGISRAGEIVDIASQYGIIEKAGSWYSYNDMKIGQGRENVKQFLLDNQEMMEEIEVQVRRTLLKSRVSENDLIEDALSETKVNMDDFSDLDDTVDLNI